MKNSIPPYLSEAVQALAQNLYASEPFLHYQQAKSALDADTQAQALLNDLTQTQERVRQPRNSGTLQQTDVESLRMLQSQVQANTTIMNYVTTQQEAVDFLREINIEISQYLGIDFAVYAQNNTC